MPTISQMDLLGGVEEFHEAGRGVIPNTPNHFRELSGEIIGVLAFDPDNGDLKLETTPDKKTLPVETQD